MAQAVSRLALLMQMLDISNNDMARNLDVDHSLFSKWKNNQRRIPLKNDMLPKIVEYLISSDEDQGGRILSPLLCPNRNSQPPGRDMLSRLLTQWLQERGPVNQNVNHDQPPQIWLSEDHYVCPMEVFQGENGRRMAILRFFDTAATLPPDIPILMLTQEDTEWLNDNSDFQKQFQLKLSTLAAGQHKMELIHWIDRKPEDLQAIVRHWLPLHMLTSMQSCYYPVYGDVSLPMTLFVIPGHIALHGSTALASPGKRHTMIYSDPGTVSQSEWIFRTTQAHCQPLVQNYRTSDIVAMSTRFGPLFQQAAEKQFCLQTSLPTLMSWPRDLMAQIMDDNHLDNEQRRLIELNWSTIHTFDGQTGQAGKKARHIYLLDSLEKAVTKPFTEEWMLSAITGKPILVSQAILRKQLQAIAATLRQNNRLEIALIRADPFHQSAWPNIMIMTGAFATAWSPNNPNGHVFFHEATLVQGFQRYFNDIWQKIPRICRDNEQVADQLLTIAAIT